ncbi:hypothetical protein MLD38_003530 [Melastoma candidum]|uniref:Uncharacterized protein n=1 Tax=Melastoma candidum TaxID=119954 RepID=A0ACB9S306_9MYRT|nr:hypothetical protein MLD38_003530 [Melastoma candidum]
MEFSSASATDVVAASPMPSLSPTSSSSPPSLSSNGSGSMTSAVTNAASHVVNPCAACKILRRRCVDKCVLAPYFPPTEPSKFIVAHRVFGASNIIKLLQVKLPVQL